MPETNAERLERLGMMEDETIYEISQEKRCEVCNREISKNLSPTNPTCEGRWCDEAIDLWLEEEAEDNEL